MRNRHINTERVVSIVGFFFLVVACISAWNMTGDRFSILERLGPTRYIITFTHGICALACFILIFNPSFKITAFILLVESTLTILTSYEQMGIFFFYAFLILAVLRGSLAKHTISKLISLYSVHLLTVLLVFPHGWPRVWVALTTSIFYLAFYFWIYTMLKAQLSCFIPANVSENEALANKKHGDIIKLSDYGLNERQTQLVIGYIKQNLSYKDLAEKYFLSISTVKKEFSDIFKIFNVAKVEELKMLLLQYQIEE